MTQEDSIRTKTWVTNDGRYLTVDEISNSHLRIIRGWLLSDLSPEYDLAYGRELARNWAACEKLKDLFELDRCAYAATWIQIIDDELTCRS